MCSATGLKNAVRIETYFPCPVYVIDAPEFLGSVKAVSDQYIGESHACQKLDAIYPLMMSGSFMNDPRVRDFAEFVASTAWNILDGQGYDMQYFNTAIESMWTQEHHKQSSMERHIHGRGTQIVGFYFVDVPEGSSRAVFHDPRSGKLMSDLPEKDISAATSASQMINMQAVPGRMILSNSWLPHSFTRHAGETPLRFVHFNVGVVPSDKAISTFFQQPAEVV